MKEVKVARLLKVIVLVGITVRLAAAQTSNTNCFNYPTSNQNGLQVITLPAGAECAISLTTPNQGNKILEVEVDYTAPIQMNSLQCPPAEYCTSQQVYPSTNYVFQGVNQTSYYVTYYISNWDSQPNSFGVSIVYDGSFSSGALQLASQVTTILGALFMLYSLIA